MKKENSKEGISIPYDIYCSYWSNDLVMARIFPLQLPKVVPGS